MLGGPADGDGAGAALTALKAALLEDARALGLAGLGVTRPDAVRAEGERLRAWVAAGRHGAMAWMADRLRWRADPTALWPEARAVAMVAESYTPPADPATGGAADPLAVLERPDRAAISVYAQNRDYHDLLKKKLKRLGRGLIDRARADFGETEIKVFVDTAPVMEKPLAQAAGLGWTGKHTNLVGRDLGSWFFLGALFTTLALPADAPEIDHCGRCRRCLDICPTAAFPAPYQLDARRCVSYLTIELKGPIPREMRAAMGNRVYGCDDCLAVCPWNKFAQAAQEAGYSARADLSAPALVALAALDEAAFRARFRGSPIKRIGRARFLRNVAVALGNLAGAPGAEARSGAQAAVTRLLSDESALVRGAAIWALARLDPGEAARRAAARTPDPDPEVEDEWRAALTR